VLAVALAAALIALTVVLLAGPPRPAASATPPASPAASATPPASPAVRSAPDKPRIPARQRHRPPARPASRPASPLPPVAAAAAALAGDLQAAAGSGQLTQQAGQDLFNHLEQVLFPPPGQDPQQRRQQYAQLVRAFDQHLSHGDITATAAAAVHRALVALGAALG
jgi:eukaryotic-like serine/threonine-protein kinase